MAVGAMHKLIFEIPDQANSWIETEHPPNMVTLSRSKAWHKNRPSQWSNQIVFISDIKQNWIHKVLFSDVYVKGFSNVIICCKLQS